MKWLLLTGSLLFCGTLCSGQNTLHSNNNLRYSLRKPMLYSISSGTTVLTQPVYTPPQPLVFKSPVHYDAFFCRMEQHSADKLKVWVKIHAGDYDRYGKERMVREELRIKN